MTGPRNVADGNIRADYLDRSRLDRFLVLRSLLLSLLQPLVLGQLSSGAANGAVDVSSGPVCTNMVWLGPTVASLTTITKGAAGRTQSGC